MLEAFPLGVGTVLRLERDAWSMVERLRQATNAYPPPRHHGPVSYLPTLGIISLQSSGRFEAEPAMLERRQLAAPKIHVTVTVIHQQNALAAQVVFIQIYAPHRERRVQTPSRGLRGRR